jgi:hypothetical protein
LKATKADDAQVRVEMWNKELEEAMQVGEGEKLAQVVDAIRGLCLGWWRHRLFQSFFCWLYQTPEYQGVGLNDMSHVVDKVQENTPGLGERIYCSAPLGRAVYCDWWSE